MPMHIRHLPGKAAHIIEESSVPKNHVLLNPSFASPILYLRGTEHSATAMNNYAILFDTSTGKQTKIPPPPEFLAPCVNLFRGIEDFRICWHKGTLWFTGTTTHASDHMTNELLVGYFSPGLDKIERMCTVDIGSLPVKNVCPFSYEGELMLLDAYLMQIYQLVDVVDETGIWKKYDSKPWKPLQYAGSLGNEKYRGSTSPVHLHGNTWGCVVHDIIFNDSVRLVTRLSYLHHWMEFDISTGVITFVSSPFWVAHWGVEYVSGLSYNKENGEATLYMGVNDVSPLMYHTTLHDLRVGK